MKKSDEIMRLIYNFIVEYIGTQDIEERRLLYDLLELRVKKIIGDEEEKCNNICDCYDNGRCNGTKEREEVSCKGDKNSVRCVYYKKYLDMLQASTGYDFLQVGQDREINSKDIRIDNLTSALQQLSKEVNDALGNGIREERYMENVPF